VVHFLSFGITRNRVLKLSTALPANFSLDQIAESGSSGYGGISDARPFGPIDVNGCDLVRDAVLRPPPELFRESVVLSANWKLSERRSSAK